jgi:hypothetical protein
MFKIATLAPDSSLKLPPEIAQHFLPSDRFFVWLEEDTLHLKRVAPSPLKRVDEAPEGQPMSLDEISEMVHEVRRQRGERKAQ